jgi:UDP-N-acetylmuramoyl-L-alanyl-D-glutamate--2,6-diaminopimelate ligase
MARSQSYTDLDSVLNAVEVVRRSGSNTPLHGVEYDSRRVQWGSLFVAMRGGKADGNRYIEQAIRAGASAIATDSAESFDRLRRELPQIAAVEVTDGRRALAGIAANFFLHPERSLKLNGITGTNGKTTTAYLLDAILRQSGRRTMLIGTIEYHIASQVRPSPHTTPESRDLFELFRESVDAGATDAVMEVSSHALSQCRVFGMSFDTAVFTNLTQDHLDYHGTMEGYFASKRTLFDGSQAPAPRAAILNSDDEYGCKLRETAFSAGSLQVFTYGVRTGDFRAEDLSLSAAGMSFRLKTPGGDALIHAHLTGRVNAYNILAATAAAVARGLTLETIAEGIASLPGVPGRFESVVEGQDFAVIVDYAHTDDALKNVLAAARDLVAPAGGRVITVFGCGGDRDRKKRPLMGKAAGVASDIVVLTSDNPRSEDPEAILRDILPGLAGVRSEVLVEADREQAIELAVGLARKGDLVLLAGKGHERTQTLRDRVIPFDDVAVARNALKNRRNKA